MKVAISGIRDLSPFDLPVVEGVMADIISEHPSEIIFGGAIGADTVALAAACAILEGKRPPKLTVIVPKRLQDQPLVAQEWAKECADEVIELKAPRLDHEAYRRRNLAMIRRADGLVAFWDGVSGGTGMTIDLAREAGIPIEIIGLSGPSSGLGNSEPSGHKPISAYKTPWPHWVYAPTKSVGMQVTTLGFYMAAVEGLDRLTQFIRATKAGTVRASETNYWGTVAANVISSRPELSDAMAILPVPRRVPGRPNDLSNLVARIANETGKINGTGLLIRTEEPAGGEFKGGRDRFTADEHTRTISIDQEHNSYDLLKGRSKVILMDNVLTFGGTLEGSRRALLRDLPDIVPTGFSMLISGDYSL